MTTTEVSADQQLAIAQSLSQRIPVSAQQTLLCWRPCQEKVSAAVLWSLTDATVLIMPSTCVQLCKLRVVTSGVLALVARTGEVDAMSKAKDVLNSASYS